MILPPGTVLPPLDGVEVSAPPAGQAATPRGSRRTGKTPPESSGRFATINSFVDGTMARLPRAAALIWLALWRDERRGLSRTGLTDLARRAGCEHRTARRAVATLEKQGLVEKVRRGRLGSGPSVYRVSPVSRSSGAPSDRS
ncbi:MAG: transcriptional regulator [Planctomycetota bacterium]|nr:MAG: transcriptional regulator [Planctomycetota bacterium]